MNLADELHERATTRTGLTDFGDDEYVEGLHALLDGYEYEAGLTEKGRAKVEGALANALAGRLRTESAWREHPAHAETPGGRVPRRRRRPDPTARAGDRHERLQHDEGPGSSPGLRAGGGGCGI